MEVGWYSLGTRELSSPEENSLAPRVYCLELWIRNGYKVFRGVNGELNLESSAREMGVDGRNMTFSRSRCSCLKLDLEIGRSAGLIMDNDQLGVCWCRWGGNRTALVSRRSINLRIRLKAGSGRKGRVGGRLCLMRCTMMRKHWILAKSTVPVRMVTFDKTMW